MPESDAASRRAGSCSGGPGSAPSRDPIRAASAARPARNAAAPPCEGWRTYGPPSRACASRPTATTRRPSASSRRNGSDCVDLGAGRLPVRLRRARMRRDEVPEQDVVLEPELRERPLHDRRGRLRRPAAGQLALGGERNPRDARAAVAGRLADEQDPRPAPFAAGSRSSRARRSSESAYWLKVAPIRAAASRSTKPVVIASA